jgi:uncharacterized protein with HEPN domain
MSRSHFSYLQHIRDEATYIAAALAGVSKDDFMADETLKRAIVRSVEVIGEAVKNLPSDLKQKYPAVDWRSIAGMRDVLIHRYFGLDYDLVWDAAASEVPALNEYVKDILRLERDEPSNT